MMPTAIILYLRKSLGSKLLQKAARMTNYQINPQPCNKPTGIVNQLLLLERERAIK